MLIENRVQFGKVVWADQWQHRFDPFIMSALCADVGGRYEAFLCKVRGWMFWFSISRGVFEDVVYV